MLQVSRRAVLPRRRGLCGNVLRAGAVPQLLAGIIHKPHVGKRCYLRLETAKEVLPGNNILAALIHSEYRLSGGLLQDTKETLLILFVKGLDNRGPAIQDRLSLGRNAGIVKGCLNVVEEPRKRKNREGAENEYGYEKTKCSLLSDIHRDRRASGQR